jgi:peptidoglycan/xylan/chitin deacetylase (PgdA/CDA1 family)
MTRVIVRRAQVLCGVSLVSLALAACSFEASTTVDASADPDAAPAADAAPDVPDTPLGPPQLHSIAPTLGSVAGGDAVTITGDNFALGTAVEIGGVPCTPVEVRSAYEVVCTTGDHDFAEGDKDVTVTTSAGTATLKGAFMVQCPWTTSAGRRSCGAVPPRQPVAAQAVASWVSQLQAGHGFVAGGAANVADNLNDTTDAALGTQSAVIQTDGAGSPRTLSRTGLPAIDFTNHVPKIWVKVDNVTRASTLQLVLGDSGFANAYRFAFHSTQGQKWTTEGDWVALTISWSPANVSVVGTPNRAAITDVQLRVVDNATGTPVRLHVNGIALVPEPVQTFPHGVVSITFDDNFATMVSAGAPTLAAHNYPATAYIIAELVGKPGRATLADLQTLQNTRGWEIAAHAHVGANHTARFTNLAPQVLEDDLVDMRAWLIGHGLRGYDHCAYPGGEFTGGTGTNVLALARRYFASCRAIYQGEREMVPPADAAKLRVFYITNQTTLAQAKTAVDQAKAHREWIILVFHNLVASPASSTQWGAANFDTLVGHIASTGMPVKTVGAVLAAP